VATTSVAETLRLEPAAGVSVEWEPDALMRAADTSDPEAPAAWSGEVDWSSFESLRLITCAAGDEALAVAVARPRGADRHDADAIACVRVGATGIESVADALLSTEYDPDGQVRRLGLELRSADGGGARAAADRSGKPAEGSADGLTREATPLDFRLDGIPGTGLHELVRAT
jgi:hypothetical protein